MRRCNIVPLIILVLSIINFALAAPALIPRKFQAYDDVVHVPKDVITVLRKRADEASWMMRLFETFDNLWGSSSSESMTSASESGSEAGSHETDSVGSGSEHHSEPGSENHDRESVDVGHDAPGVSSPESIKSGHSSHDAPGVSSQEQWTEFGQSNHDALGVSNQEPLTESGKSSHDALGVSNQEPSIESGQSSMQPPDSGRFPIGMHSPGSDSDSGRWSTIANSPSSESLYENLQSANAGLKGKLKVERRITGSTRGAANAA